MFNSPLQIYILMAGRGERFRQNNFNTVKPLILWQNKPLFLWALESVRALLPSATLHFVICEEDQIQQQVLSFIQEDPFLRGLSTNLITLTARTTGPAMSAKLALEQSAPQHQGPIIFCDCDLICITAAWNNFVLDWPDDTAGALLWFKASKNKHSFLKSDPNDLVTDVAEKIMISDQAIAGIYAFQNAHIFQEAIQNVLFDEGEKYLSHVYAELIKIRKIIRAFPVDHITLLGTPDELLTAEFIQ